MHDLLAGASGEWLSREEYGEAFASDFWRIEEPGFWKLERQQTFREPNNESWVAFSQGEWAEALRQIEAQRPGRESYFQKIAEVGFRTRRARIIDYPVSPYLQWELHYLRAAADLGDEINIVKGAQIERLEATEELPELVTLGADVLYQIVYDNEGILEGAVRFVDRDLVQRCQQFIQELYESGEKLEDFFEREVLTWDPPRVG